ETASRIDSITKSRALGTKSAMAAIAGTMARATAAAGSDAMTSHQGALAAGALTAATPTSAAWRSTSIRAMTASVKPAGAGGADRPIVASIASSATASAMARAQASHPRAWARAAAASRDGMPSFSQRSTPSHQIIAASAGTPRTRSRRIRARRTRAFGEKPPERRAGPAQVRLHGSFGHLEGAPNLRHGPILVVEKRHDRALHVREWSDHLLESLGMGTFRAAGRRDPAQAFRHALVLERDFPAAPGLQDRRAIQRAPPDDAIEPGGKRRLASKFTDRAPCADEGVLRHLLGVRS